MTERTGSGRGGLARLAGPPLIIQVIGLIVGALIAAQLVTLLLTLVLPPAPPRRYALADIAEALKVSGGGDSRFDRVVQPGPPDLSAPGWFVSDSARLNLAAMLRRPAPEVALGFYTQLPVGGSVQPVAPPRPLAGDAGRTPIVDLGSATPVELEASLPVGALARAHLVPAAFMQQMPGAPPGNGFPGGPPGGGFLGAGLPGSGFPQSLPQPPRPTAPPPVPPAMQQQPTAPPPPPRAPAPNPGAPGPGSSAPPAPGPLGSQPQPATPPPNPGLPGPSTGMPGGLPPTGLSVPPPLVLPPVRKPPSPTPHVATTPVPVTPSTGGSAAPVRAASAPSPTEPVPTTTSPSAPAAPTPALTVRKVAPAAATPVQGRPVPIMRREAGLFGLAPAPFVEGDFIAGARLTDGRWAVVSPRPEDFPNAWQRRVGLWFLLSLLAVAPVAWLFARRIVGPLNQFAHAADVLGRDPGAAVLPLTGPAEIGRAAHAFNQMQSRLRSFVDDRTAMIGAISHDLRTPLTRLRFRIEDVPENQQDGLRDEVAAMEAMITSVIAFMRDASVPNARERRDLAEIVDDVVEDAKLLGDVSAERLDSAMVDVDPLGIRRVLDNLLVNAMKYGGGHARIELRVEEARAVADIVDAGPGVPEGEVERLFEPFYRSEDARRSGREGSGLGLAVCRSIARAHGGDVALFRSPQGFTARVTLPLAFQQAA